MLPAVIENAILGIQERVILPHVAPAPPVAAPSSNYGTFTWAAEGKTKSSMHRLSIDYSLPAHDFSVNTAWSLFALYATVLPPISYCGCQEGDVGEGYGGPVGQASHHAHSAILCAGGRK
jgi:hypothetical protein